LENGTEKLKKLFLRFRDRPLSSGGARGGRSRAANLQAAQKNTKVYTPISFFRANLKKI